MAVLLTTKLTRVMMRLQFNRKGKQYGAILQKPFEVYR